MNNKLSMKLFTKLSKWKQNKKSASTFNIVIGILTMESECGSSYI